MSFFSRIGRVLKKAGKKAGSVASDLGHVSHDVLNVAAPVVATVAPAFGPQGAALAAGVIALKTVADKVDPGVSSEPTDADAVKALNTLAQVSK